MLKSNQGEMQRSRAIKVRLLPALVGVWAVLAGSSLHSATIQLDVTLAAGTSINSAGGSLVSGGTAYVGSFFNGSTAMSKSAVAALWNSTRAGFTSLWSSFVSVANAGVSSGGFTISTQAEVSSVVGKNLVGKNVYVLVVDNAASPTGFLLLAADGSGVFDTFADPADTWGDAETLLEVAGEASTLTIGGETYDQSATTSVVGTSGTYNASTDRWTMASIPGGVSTPTIIGAATATAFTTTYGTASVEQTFIISGSNLTANLVVTAPAGYEVSSNGTTYGSTATFVQSGGSASGTLRLRLAATAVVSASYNSQNIVLASTGATSVNVTTATSGNSVSAKALTISGLTAENKDVDGTTSATVTGTPSYVGLANSETFSVTGSVTWAFPDSAVGVNKTLTRTGSYAPPSGNYTVTQPTLTASIRALPTLRLLGLGVPAYAGGNTTVIHTFAVNSTGVYVLGYKSSLSDVWSEMSVTVSNNNSFSVTFINSGVNTSTEWKNRMFFRVRNS
jgi:YDG domain